MADSQIKMTLSLLDNASPQLVSFMEKLKALEASLASANKAFQSFNAAASSTSEGAGKASSAFAEVSSVLSAMDAKLLAASERFAALGVAATSAAGSMGLATAEMNAAGASATRFEGRLSSLGSTIKSVAEIWAAAKIGHGLEEAGEKAAQYEASQTRFANLNMGPQANASLRAEAERISKEMPQLNQNVLFEMGHDLVNITGSAKEAPEQLEMFAKAALAMKNATPEGKLNERDVLNIGKALELRGAGMDPQRMQAELEKFAQIVAATQGRVGTQALLGNIKYSKGGLGNTMDIEFLPYFASMIEMIQSSGGNGGQVGTMLTSLQKLVMGGPEQALRGNWQANGLLDKNGQIAGADDFQRNPYKWVQEVFKPALEKAGVDMADAARVNQIINSLTGNRNAAQALSTMTNQGDQIAKDAKIINNTAGIDEQNSRNLETARARYEALKGSIENLAMTLGEKLLPIFKEVADWLVSSINGIDGFLKENEMSAKAVAIGAALSAIGMAISAVGSLFGLLAPAAAAAGAGMLAPMLAFASRMGPIAIAGVAAFTAGFVFWDAIKNFQAFGTTIGNIATQTVVGVIAIFDRLVTYLRTAVLGGMEKIIAVAADVAAKAGATDTAYKLQDASASLAAAKASLNKGYNAREGIRSWMEVEGDQQARAVIANKNAPKPEHGKAAHLDTGKDGFDWDGKRSQDNFKITPKGAGGGGGGGRAMRDPAIAEANQAARVEREGIAQHLKEIEALYRDHKVGVEELYNTKTDAIKRGTAEQIAQLEKEKAALEKDPARNASQIARVNADIEIAKMKEKAALADVERQRNQEMQKLTKDGAKLSADIEAVTRSGTEKRVALLEEEYAKKKKIFEINGMMAQAAEVEEQKSMAIAKLKFDAQTQEIERMKTAEKLGEQRLQNAVAAGAMTSLEAAQRTNDLRMEEGRILDSLIEKLERMAIESRNPALLDQVAKLKVEAEGLKYQFDEVTKSLRGGVQDGIEGALSALTGGKGWKAALKSLEQSILAPLNKMASKQISEALTNALFGKADGTGGGDGPFGKIAQQLFGKGSVSAGVSSFATAGKDALVDNGAKVANDALTKLASDGAQSSTQSLIEQATKTTMGTTVQELATNALQGLASAAQQAAAALQSVGSSGGGGGGGGLLGSLFGGGGGGGVLESFASFDSAAPFAMASFDVGADNIPRDMIAKIHKGEMILPADTANRVRNGMASGSGGGGSMVVNNNFTVQGPTNRQTQSQIASQAASAMARAQRRNR